MYKLPSEEEVMEDFEDEFDMCFNGLMFAVKRAKGAIDLIEKISESEDYELIMRTMDNVEDNINDLSSEFHQAHSVLEQIVHIINSKKSEAAKIEEQNAFNQKQKEWIID
jgi:archaellum component FlaC